MTCSMQALSLGQRLSGKGWRDAEPGGRRQCGRSRGHQRLAGDRVGRAGRVSAHRQRQHLLDRARRLRLDGDGGGACLPHLAHRERRQPDAREGLLATARGLLNPAATAAYIEATHQGYYDAMPELFGTTILGFRGDEPDYSIAGLPWTPKFFDTFQQVKGYDIRPYLGALLLSAGGGGRPRPAAAVPGATTTPAAAQAAQAHASTACGEADGRRAARQGRLLRRLLADVPRRLLQAAGAVVRGAWRGVPGPPEP